MSGFVRKLKEEAIARGLTEPTHEREARQTDSAASSASVSVASTKDELLAFIRQQTTAVTRLREQLAHSKEAHARAQSDLTESANRVTTLQNQVRLDADRAARHASTLEQVTAARDDARLRLQELRLQAVTLEQQLHDALERTDSSGIATELTRLRDARVAADAARSAAESEVASLKQQLAHAEQALLAARHEFSSVVTHAHAAHQVAADSGAPAPPAAVAAAAVQPASDARVSELNAALARMAASDARNVQLVATLELRVERHAMQVDELTRRLHAASEARDAALASAAEAQRECAALRAELSALRSAPPPPAVVVQEAPRDDARVAALEQEVRDARAAADAAQLKAGETQAALEQLVGELRQQLTVCDAEKAEAVARAAELRKVADDAEEMCAQKTRALARLRSELVQLSSAAAPSAAVVAPPSDEQLRRENETLRSLLAEYHEEEELRAMQVRILKQEIAELARCGSRRDVDLTVVKNAVLQMFGKPREQQEGFVRVLGSLLSFSPLEMRVATDAVRNVTV